MKMTFLTLAVSVLGGCVVGEESEIVLADEGLEEELDVLHDDDPVYDEDPAGLHVALVVGGWAPPASVRTAGDAQYVAYTGAGPFNGGAGCSGGLKAGTRAVGDYARTYAGVTGYGGYNCRPNTANTSELSVHGTGRALDIMIPLRGGDADNERGDRIANYLVQNAQAMGIQFIIWDRVSWGASRAAPKFRDYTGPNPHKDHLHVELSPQGAAKQTPWFSTNGGGGGGGGTATVVDASSLNLRSGPSTAYGVVAVMPGGAVVTVVAGPSNGWYNVTYQGKTGWASGRYLRL